jgi:tRNA nucleotidyltransferase (CCA-adding enzyme)
MAADALGPPAAAPRRHPRLVDRLRARASALALEAAAPKPIILGRHLIAMGRKPGPEFKPLLDAAFEAQLDGAFTDEAGGLAWLRGRLR